ncbi:hypothetical protein ACSZNF_13640 [Aeromonas hydrophila]
MTTIHRFTHNGVDHEVRYYNDGSEHFVAAFANGEVVGTPYKADNETVADYNKAPVSQDGFLKDMARSIENDVRNGNFKI